MLNFILNLFAKKHNTGVLIDNRHPEEKKKDYLHEEIVADASLSVYRTKEDILPITKKYYKENQYMTLSCVAHGDTLALGIDNELEGNGYVRLSKAFFYRLRVGYPGGGMNGDNAGQIAVNYASPRYEMLPTPNTEQGINTVSVSDSMYIDAKQYRAKAYVRINNCKDIGVLNSVASQGKAIPMMIYATTREWAQEYPKVLDKVIPEYAPIRHEVCILPNSGFIENGVKYVAVQDSAWFGGLNIRFLSEDFIKQRCFYAKYFVNLQNISVPIASSKPFHTFTQSMKFGDTNNEVRWLQTCLQYEGLFPKNITPTGFFGGLTLKAVNEFQKKYAAEILLPLGLLASTGFVGSATIKKLNQLFA